MFRYVLKRLLIFLPTFIAISLITFFVSQNAPGDPVAEMLSGTRGPDGAQFRTAAGEKAYLYKRAELGLDLPIFYFSFSSKAFPDTLHRIAKASHRSALKRLIQQYGNWPRIEDYYQGLRTLRIAMSRITSDSLNAQPLVVMTDVVERLQQSSEHEPITVLLQTLHAESSKAASLQSLVPHVSTVEQTYGETRNHPTRWKKYIPSIHFYGLNSQYHRWLFGSRESGGFIRGDFGLSYKTHRPVANEIWEAVGITLKLSLLAILFTYIIAVPLGVWSAVRKGGMFDQFVTTSLFALYSLPAFWVGVLLIVYFGGGDFLNWFPPGGLGDTRELHTDASWWERFSYRASHLILPLIVLTYPTLAFLSRHARGGIINVLSQDYIRTAYAKGLPQGKVVWKHGFRNAMLPVLTLFANVFPYAIAGSVVVEVVFNIPGMGRLALDAVYDRNFPIVYTVVMLAAVLTILGYLVVDILYAAVDPRITFKSSKR